ncbi:hypothetical protein H0H92_010918, partial [Tricholoma furcatifolium]
MAGVLNCLHVTKVEEDDTKPSHLGGEVVSKVENGDEKLDFKREKSQLEDTKIGVRVEKAKKEEDLKVDLDDLKKPLQGPRIDIFGNEMVEDEESNSGRRSSLPVPAVDIFGNEIPLPDEYATSGHSFSQERTERTIEEVVFVPQQVDLQDDTFVPEGINIIDVDLYVEPMEEEILNPKVRDATLRMVEAIVPQQVDLQDDTLVPEDIEIIDVDSYAETMEKEILKPEPREPISVTERTVQDQQQRKRPRLILDAIEVPTLEEILRRDSQDREDLKKVEKMLNPKTTLKKTEFCFSLDTIRDRLRP